MMSFNYDIFNFHTKQADLETIFVLQNAFNVMPVLFFHEHNPGRYYKEQPSLKYSTASPNCTLFLKNIEQRELFPLSFSDRFRVSSNAERFLSNAHDCLSRWNNISPMMILTINSSTNLLIVTYAESS